MNKKDIHLVLIHGFMFDRTAWEKPAAVLAQTYTVHIVDLPGYGKNVNTKAHSLADIAKDIISNIGDVPKIIWIGWSLGGVVANYLAYQFPHISLGVITLASNPKFIKSDDWPCGASYDAFTTLKNAFIQQPKAAEQRFIMLQSQSISFSSIKNIPKLKAYFKSLPLDILLRDLDILEHTDLRSIMSELTLPQLTILADNDRLVPMSIVDELKRLSPRAHTVIIKNAGHAMLISHIDECLTTIQNFINESIITQ